MKIGNSIYREIRKWVFPVVIIFSSTMIFLSSSYNSVLFYFLVEFFSIVISFGIFVVTWSSRKQVNNLFLMLLGVGYFFVGIFDLVHFFSYGDLRAINVSENFTNSLWLVARFMEASFFILALSFFKKDKIRMFSEIVSKSSKIFLYYFVMFCLLWFLIISSDKWLFFGVGEDNFAIFFHYSNYIIALIFFACLFLLLKRRNGIIDDESLNLIVLSLIMKIIASIIFAINYNNNEFYNIFAMLARFISFALLYKVFLEIAIVKPYEFLFSDLKKSESRYRSLVEFSPDSIVVHRIGKIIYANGPAKKLLLRSTKESILGLMLYDFFHIKYANIIKSQIKHIYEGKIKKVAATEMEILQPDGKTVSVEIKSQKIIYEGEVSIESIIHNISKRKKAQKKIQSLARFTEENPNPVMSISKMGEIKYSNPPADRMIEFFNIKGEEYLPQEFIHLIRHVIENKLNKYEAELTCEKGNIFHVTLYFNEDSPDINFYTVDITKRRRAEKKLLQAQARLRRQAENQLLESHKYLGTINRKISMLLELKKLSIEKLGKQEAFDYIAGSIFKLTSAEAVFLYRVINENYFSLISSLFKGENNVRKDLRIINLSKANFLKKLLMSKARISGRTSLIDLGCFKGIRNIQYTVTLPIIIDEELKGFIFLAFSDREGMDKDELKFLDVFAMHAGAAIKSVNGFK